MLGVTRSIMVCH